MADRVGHADDTVTEKGDVTSPRAGEGSLMRSKDEWGSIIDILHSIENTTQPGKPVQSAPTPSTRLEPLSENIQSTGMMSVGDFKQGQGLQQLDHLVRMMEQMCHLQKQNSRLREHAEYLAAIKDLQELRNESLVQNCKCESHRHSSESSRVPDETFSEPESTVGDEMESKRELSPTREKRASRSIKREPKTKGSKKRSRSLDPYRKDTAEPAEKDIERDRERERGRPGIFSKFERMKEKLTTRRGSVKKHTVNKRMDDKQEEELRANALSNENFNLQMDGTETKSEDSGIFHVGLDEIVNLPRLTSDILPKSQDELSDNEDVFTALQPSWNQANNFSMETRKGSDFSTGSSSEDYLELKPKRTTPQKEEPAVLRSPERQRKRGDSEERVAKSSDEKEENVRRKMRVRRSASLQDNISLNSDDEEFEKPTKTAWEVKEAPAILQGNSSSRNQLQNSPSMDYDLSDASLDMQTGQDSASTSSLESKAAQKRKYFRKSHHVEEPTSPTTDQRLKTVAFDMKSPKSSPPEKKRHKVGWEKVKHAVTRKHLGEISKTKATVSMDENILRSSEEPSSPTDSSPPEDTYGGKARRSEVKKGDPKREKERGPPPDAQQSPLTLYESLQANLSEDFAKKMEKWDKKKQRHGAAGMSPLEKAKQSSVDSCSSEAGTIPTSDLEAELQKGLTEDFYKKLAEWDKLKQQKGGAMGPSSPKAEPKQKQKGAKEGKKTAKTGKGNSKEKEREKTKTKDSTPQRSKSPESTSQRKISPPSEAIYTTENITVFAKQGGKLKLEGASKEFSKKYKEWEKKEKKKRNYPPVRAEDIPSPIFEQAQPYPGRDSTTPPTPSSPATNESTDQEPGELFVIAHATPVIVEPDYVNGSTRLARAGDPIFRTQSAPPATVPAATLGDTSQVERPSSQRVLNTDEDVFTTEAVPGSPIPQEKVSRLEQRNSFLAEQLKSEDVNLLAVQEEIVNMDEQLAEISGEKPEDRMERRVSTCSSIGESALEAELFDIKQQIAQLEENLRKRPRHKGHHGVKGQEEVKGSSEDASKKVDEGTDTADFTPYPIPTVEAEGGAQADEQAAKSAANKEEADVHSDLTQALEKSLQEREAIIKLLQARVERQAQEINYLKNGSDMANLFRRAKSFTARDKKTFDPRVMKVVDINLDKPEAAKGKMQSDDRSESSKSLKTDSTPSLETLHISAEDIRLDETAEEKQEKQRPTEETKSPEVQLNESNNSQEEKLLERPAVESTADQSTEQVDQKVVEEEYPGLYGPIETKLKRRRNRSAELPPSTADSQETHVKDSSTRDAHSADSRAAVDSLLAKKTEDECLVQDASSKDGSMSPRSLRMMKSREPDGEVKSPSSPSAEGRKVVPKFELVKLADGLKSQAVELSPRTQRRRERESQGDTKSGGGMSPRSSRGSRRSPRGKQESRESISTNESQQTTKCTSPVETQDTSESILSRQGNQELQTEQATSKDKTSKTNEKVEEKDLMLKEPSSVGPGDSGKSPEKQLGRRLQTERTLSQEMEVPTRSSKQEKERASSGRETERRPSVENLRAAIEKRQRSFSETTDSDQEPLSNAKKALENRLSNRINSERRDSSESVGSNKQSPLDKREPVLMRTNHRNEDKSVASLRRKFVSQEYGSTPNVTDLSTLLTSRKERERPREGCVKQMSQAFSLVSLSEQGAGDQRRGSKSSSVHSSPKSLSPASSNSSLSNIVASQIKRLQDKASSSPESPERRVSIQNKSAKDLPPSLYSLHGRLEHRQSLTNVADVRAKFDKKAESPTTSDSSPMASRTSSPADLRRHTRKEPAKPTLVPSVAAARIKYTVSVSNSENNGPPKKSVSLHQNGSTRSQRMIAVQESSQTEKSVKSDSTVTFTINQNQRGRQSAAKFEENNNNSNNNNKNYTARVDVRRKGSSISTAEASNRPYEKQGKSVKEIEDRGVTRKGSLSRSDKRRGSLPRQTESSRDSSRRGSLTKGKESPKEPTRRRSFSKEKESPKSGSRRGSVTKSRDTSSDSSKGKPAPKDSEPSKELCSLHVPGAEPEDDERSRRRRRRRERNTPSPEPPRAQAKAEGTTPEVSSDIKTARQPVNSETKLKPNTDSKQEVKQENKQKDRSEDQSKVKHDSTRNNQPRIKSEAKTEVKQEVRTEVKSVKSDTKSEVKAEVKAEVKPEVKPEVKLEVKPEVKSEGKLPVKSEIKPDGKSDAKLEVKPEVKPDRAQERRNRREERARRQREREAEAARTKEDIARAKAEKDAEASRLKEAAKIKAEAARAKVMQELEKARVAEEAARVKAERETKESKRATRIEKRESRRAERRELQKDKAVEKVDSKKTTSELASPVSDTSASSVQRRHSKREEQKPAPLPQASCQDSPKPGIAEDSIKSKEEDPNMPDLLAQAQKTGGEPSAAEDVMESRSPRTILTHSALRGAEAAIGHPLPKTPPDEEEAKEDQSDDRRSRKDATRRSRAINRGSRISRLDIFKRARSVDSSKGNKDRSPDRLLGGGGASSRSCSVDRSGKNRDKSPGGEETRKGGSWLSKRTGSISNFLRPSNDDWDIWDELEECYCILQSCSNVYRPAYEYEDLWQLRFIQETSILS